MTRHSMFSVKSALCLTLIAAGLSLAGCQTMGAAPKGRVAEESGYARNWRQIATATDRQRIRQWYSAWRQGVRAARDGGYQLQLANDAALLQPGAGLPNPFIPAGEYKCRTIKLGSQQPNGLAYVAYPYFRCQVTAEQDLFSFTKTTGSQRPVGMLFDDDERRQVFLGTIMLGDERGSIDYGTDARRDVAAVVQRIGPKRWRFIFPKPTYESVVDIMEVVPV